mgnify:CR=1 FL=1
MKRNRVLPAESGKATMIVFSASILLAGLYASSLYNYLLFHNLAEGFSVVIACGVFMVAWNTRRFAGRHFLLLIGVAYLFVGVLDFVHTLSYTGMNVIAGFAPNAPTQLWIAARYMQSLTLLAVPFMLQQRIRSGYLLAAYIAVSVLVLLSIFVWRTFPDCFLPGTGLTPFKIVSEYIICIILSAAGILMWLRRRHFDPAFLGWTLAAIAVTVVSEVAFTTYASVFGAANLLGHLLKIISFYLIYKAVIETGLAKPFDLLFKDLHRQRERFRVTLTSISDAVIASAVDGRITFLNPRAEQLTGWTADEAMGVPMSTVVQTADQQAGSSDDAPSDAVPDDFREGKSSSHASLITKSGATVPIESSVAPIIDAFGQLQGNVLVLRDIMARQKAEAALKASLAEKEVLIKEIHHRVKNNMQVISSLVDLQAEEVEDEAMRDIFRDVIYRVRSMAMVHEKLYLSTNLACVEFDDYARSLLDYLWRAQDAAVPGVALDLDLRPVSLPVNEAVPCGLILNELFTNALKHAFVNRQGGTVTVSLRTDARGTLLLSVKDDGIGLPAHVDFEKSPSLGLRLVKMLAGQLHARVDVQTDKGTAVRIRFAPSQ